MRIAVELGEASLETSARTTLRWALTQAGAYREALEILQTTRKRAEDGDEDLWQLARVYLNLTVAQQSLGQHEAAIETARTGLDFARAAGVERALGAVLYAHLTSSLAAAGRWDEAETMAIKGLELDASPPSAAALHAVRAEVALARGDLDGAREELSRAQRTPMVARQQAELALRENRISDARRAVVDALRIAGEPGEPSQIWAILTTGARVESHASLRDRVSSGADRDAVIVDELRAAADRLRADTPALSAYAAQFAAELGDGGWPVAIAAWNAIGQPYPTAYARRRPPSPKVIATRRGIGCGPPRNRLAS